MDKMTLATIISGILIATTIIGLGVRVKMFTEKNVQNCGGKRS